MWLEEKRRNKNLDTIAVSGFFAGADCETRTRDLLITKHFSDVSYYGLAWM